MVRRCAPSRWWFVVSLLMLTMVAMPGLAQVTGATLSGTVQDPAHAAVPNVQISIKNVSTGDMRYTTSNEVGVYSAPGLSPGSYELTAAAPGFSTQMRSGIMLTVGAQQELNLTMRVGSRSEKVDVTDEPPAVDLINAAIGTVVASTTITELPLNGRDWTQLASLQPGVNSVSSLQSFSAQASSQRMVRGDGDQVAISGTRSQQNNYRIDGVSINDYTNNVPGNVLGYSAGVDAVGQFRVLTSNYSAEYGKTSGGVVEAATRSGTNQIHGSAYEFLRNSALDARNYFDPPKIPPFRRNQFGASVGGPIYKDKTFFFGDYEGFRQSLGVSYEDTVPTATARAGTIFTQNPDGTISTSTVPVDPVIARMLVFWPMPNGAVLSPGNTAIYSVSTSVPAHDDFVDGRIDHTFSPRDSFSTSYQFDRSYVALSGDDLAETINRQTAGRQLVALQETHIFGPKFVNSLRFGFARDSAVSPSNTSSTVPAASDPTLGSVPGQNVGQITVPGLTVFNGGVGAGTPVIHHFNSFQVYDDATINKGIHTLTFGGSVERQQDNMLLGAETGSVSFSSLSAFLENAPHSYKATVVPPPVTERGFRDSIFGVYINDDMRVKPNFTANLGLRYEMSTVPSEVNGKMANLPTLTAAAPITGNFYFSNSTLRNVEPRVGFAWDPFKDGKSSVRAGFGIYDVLPTTYLLPTEMPEAAPFLLNGSIKPVPQGAYPTNVYPLLSVSSFRDPYYDPNIKRNYVMQWNLSVQREIVPNLTATVAYAGSKGVHMLGRMGDGDIVLPTLTSAGYLWPASGGNRINPNFGRIDFFQWNTSSSYNSLQVGVIKRMQHGFQIQGAYTWARAIDSGSGGPEPDDLANGIDTFFFDPSLTRGPSDFDVAQNLTINYTWMVPVPKALQGPLEWVIRGWQLGGIFTARTGLPFTPLIAPDPLGEGNSSAQDFPDRVPGCKLTNPGNVNAYINVNCFGVPMATPAIAANCASFSSVPGSCMNLLGNAGRNEIYGPGLIDLDSSLFKNVQIKEKFNVQFRVEAFNVLNRSNFLAPLDNSTILDVTGAPVGGAGLIDTTSTTNRQIQFALKLTW